MYIASVAMFFPRLKTTRFSGWVVVLNVSAGASRFDILPMKSVKDGETLKVMISRESLVLTMKDCSGRF